MEGKHSLLGKGRLCSSWTGALELISQTAEKESGRENITEDCISLVVSLIHDAYNRDVYRVE